MTNTTLETTAQTLVAAGKGILAADQGADFVGGWLKAMDQTPTETTSRDYREMMFRTPGLADHISGIILRDEVIEQRAVDGTPLLDLITAQGILPGISPSTGLHPLAGASGEVIPAGLDGLRERLQRWRDLGFRFSKWRGPVKIGPGLPSAYAIEANAFLLGQVAALSQEAGLVPIVEPEVEMIGDHDIQRHFEVSERFLHRVFQVLYEQRVVLEGILLKTNMILSGTTCPTQAGVEAVASATLKCFRRAVPAAVPGITFLSGGQSDEDATVHLNAMNALGPPPWVLSFSYGRALQRAPMTAWAGQVENVAAGQAALYHYAKMNGLASLGQYVPE